MGNKYRCHGCGNFYDSLKEVADCIYQDLAKEEELAKEKERLEAERLEKEAKKKEVKDTIDTLYAKIYKLCKEYSDLDDDINLVPAINIVYKKESKSAVTEPATELKTTIESNNTDSVKVKPRTASITNNANAKLNDMRTKYGRIDDTTAKQFEPTNLVETFMKLLSEA